jgi:hypothetical protein
MNSLLPLVQGLKMENGHNSQNAVSSIIPADWREHIAYFPLSSDVMPTNFHFTWVELSLSYGRRSVDKFILVSGSPLGPATRFYPYPFFSDNCFVVLPLGRPLWREDGSVTYSAIADWSGHWGPISIHYRLIWDCVPSSSPLTTRRDCSGGSLTRHHTGFTSLDR